MKVLKIILLALFVCIGYVQGARQPGLFKLTANYEPLYATTLDARMLTPYYADLTNTNTFGVFGYKGMLVSVYNDPSPTNNGLYILKGLPYTSSTNWARFQIGSDMSAAITGYSNYVASLNYVDKSVTNGLDTIVARNSEIQRATQNLITAAQGTNIVTAMAPGLSVSYATTAGSAGSATTAGTVTGAQSNLIASALTNVPTLAQVAAAGRVLDQDTTNISIYLPPQAYATHQPSAAIRFNGRGNPASQYIGEALYFSSDKGGLVVNAFAPGIDTEKSLLLGVTGNSDGSLLTGITAAGTVTGAQSNTIASALQPADTNGWVVSSHAGFVTQTITNGLLAANGNGSGLTGITAAQVGALSLAGGALNANAQLRLDIMGWPSTGTRRWKHGWDDVAFGLYWKYLDPDDGATELGQWKLPITFSDKTFASTADIDIAKTNATDPTAWLNIAALSNATLTINGVAGKMGTNLAFTVATAAQGTNADTAVQPAALANYVPMAGNVQLLGDLLFGESSFIVTRDADQTSRWTMDAPNNGMRFVYSQDSDPANLYCRWLLPKHTDKVQRTIASLGDIPSTNGLITAVQGTNIVTAMAPALSVSYATTAGSAGSATTADTVTGAQSNLIATAVQPAALENYVPLSGTTMMDGGIQWQTPSSYPYLTWALGGKDVWQQGVYSYDPTSGGNGVIGWQDASTGESVYLPYLISGDYVLATTEYADIDALDAATAVSNYVQSVAATTTNYIIAGDTASTNYTRDVAGWTTNAITSAASAGSNYVQSVAATTTNYINSRSSTSFTLTNMPGDASVSGLSNMVTFGDAVSFGSVVYAGSDKKYYLAAATNNTTLPCMGLAMGTYSAAANGWILIQGYAQVSTWAWTIGGSAGLLWVSATPGTITQTQPSTAGTYIQNIGTAITSTNIYFNPNFMILGN